MRGTGVTGRRKCTNRGRGLDEVTIELPLGQSLRASATEEGGLAIESTVRQVDGRPDHLVIRTKLSRVDARRVFQLLGEDPDR